MKQLFQTHIVAAMLAVLLLGAAVSVMYFIIRPHVAYAERHPGVELQKPIPQVFVEGADW